MSDGQCGFVEEKLRNKAIYSLMTRAHRHPGCLSRLISPESFNKRKGEMEKGGERKKSRFPSFGKTNNGTSLHDSTIEVNTDVYICFTD